MPDAENDKIVVVALRVAAILHKLAAKARAKAESFAFGQCDEETDKLFDRCVDMPADELDALPDAALLSWVREVRPDGPTQ